MPEDNVMFKIIGTDRKEYGPVTAEQLRQWIQGGRADGHTLAQAAGASDWKPLGEFPEFADVLTTRAAPGAASGKPAGPTPTSGMAIASFVLGLLGVCGITAVVGLVLGIVSLRKINRSRGQLAGQGFATAGIALSAVMLLCFIPVMAGITLPALAKAKEKALALNCRNNMMQLAVAVRLYANDSKDQYPLPAKWCDAIQPYIVNSGKILQCASHPEWRCAYAFNQKLDGKNEKEVNSQTVLLFESQAGWNTTGGREAVAPHQHSKRTVNVAFADGHVEMVPVSKLDNLRWEP